MFTGIIKILGKIIKRDLFGGQARIKIQPLTPIADYQRGESIAVNGVCLTVEDFTEDDFVVYASQETLAITNLNRLKLNSIVNLERALQMNDRLGGHVVTGHIDTAALVKSINNRGDSFSLLLNFPQEFSRFVVAKGSVTLDGISLTVNDCGADFLTVNVIPATFDNTNIKNWFAGYAANMETDLLGKYVANFLQRQNFNLDQNFLQRCGFVENNNDSL